MFVCVNCKKEMRCFKNGVDVVFGTSHVYASDVYICPECGNKIASTVAVPREDKNVLNQPAEHILQMPEES